MTITYEYEGALYVNLTNKCNCACEFCLRQGKAQGQQQGKYFFHVGVLLCLFDVFYITTKRDLFPEENKSQIHMNRAAVNKRGCALNRSLSAEDIYPHRFQQVSWLARQRLPRLLALAMASAADSSLTVTGSLRVCT